MAVIYAKNKITGEWERVSPETVEIDPSLSRAGSPADAKATGDAINEIRNEIDNISFEGLATEGYVNDRMTTKQDKLTFDEVPTDGSVNPVTSGGIKSYVDESIILKDTEIKLPASSRWLSICYGNGKFVAVGNNRKAAYSTDGTTWHETSMPSYEKWAKVVYGEDKFVALSFTKIAYSTDGINWNSVTLPSTTNSSHSWSDLAYGNGVFAITARSSTGSNPTSDYAYSTDGINWTKSNLPDALSYPHIAYGNGKFITCSGGVISSDRIYCSEDGINWSYMTYASSINNRGISYVGDKFIIKTDSSGLENLYSTDGITWNTMSTGLDTTTYSPSYGYGNGMYVAVTSNSTTDRIQYNGIALYSTDGITWTQTTMPFKCSSDVAYGNGKFVALHNYVDSYDVSTDTIMYSDDGINWRSGMSQLQTIGGENVTDDVLGALKHTHPEYETGGVQADWNQNDETAPDYIKNRPFYDTDETIDSIVLEETTFEGFVDNGGIYILEADPSSLPSFELNKTYYVNWDGTEYEVTGIDYQGFVALGNTAALGAEDTGEPFFMVTVPGMAALIASFTEGSTHTVSISSRQYVSVKLPERFYDKPVYKLVVFYNHYNHTYTISSGNYQGAYDAYKNGYHVTMTLGGSADAVLSCTSMNYGSLYFCDGTSSRDQYVYTHTCILNPDNTIESYDTESVTPDGITKAMAWRLENLDNTVDKVVFLHTPDEYGSNSNVGYANTATSGHAYKAMQEAGIGSYYTEAIIEHAIIGNYHNDTLTRVGDYAFYQCNTIESIDMPSVTNVGNHAFFQCKNLTSANLPLAVTIGDCAFDECEKLSNANFSKVQSIGSQALRSCGFTHLDFPVLSNIGTRAFQNDKLEALILRTETVCTLSNINAFSGTTIEDGTGYIYVPFALLDSYKSTYRWSTYSDQFRAIEDYPDICGGV